MQTGSGISVRAFNYDRGATPVSRGFLSGTLAPHSETLRLTYTVPADTLSVLNSISLGMSRFASASPSNLHRIFVHLNKFGASDSIIFHLFSLDNTVALEQQDNISPQTILAAGDVIEVFTLDVSIGGLILYHAEMLATEFAE